MTPGGTTGRLVLVGTPIGNLGDLSPRAVETLAGADVICCEDTRRTRQLLTHAGITGVPLMALHAHNEAAGAQRVVERAALGQTVAVVTDAGMPAISDPGERLVRAATAAGVEVSVVPGPSAVTSALAVSGLPSARFCFEGFLPARGGERAARLAEIGADTRTVVIYEAPHRVARTLNDLEAVCGPDRQVVAARELTKLHEELWRGTLSGARAWVGDNPPRGEWVLVLGPRSPGRAEATDEEVLAALEARLEGGSDRRSAVASVSADLGIPKRRAYDLALKLRAGR